MARRSTGVWAADNDHQAMQLPVSASCLAAYVREDGGRRPHSRRAFDRQHLCQSAPLGERLRGSCTSGKDERLEKRLLIRRAGCGKAASPDPWGRRRVTAASARPLGTLPDRTLDGRNRPFPAVQIRSSDGPECAKSGPCRTASRTGKIGPIADGQSHWQISWGQIP